MLRRNERNLDNIPAGTLGIIAIDGCQAMGKEVDHFITTWRHEDGHKFMDDVVFSGYQRDSYEESKAALENGDYSQYASQNREFHSEIWAAAGNKKMENMIAELWNGLSMGNMVTEQEYAKISIEEHGRIMDAIAVGDGERAKKEMYAHIMRSRDDMLTYYQ